MREYLFKAQTCNGQWVIGLLAHKGDKWYISNKAGMPFAYEVRPETISQYTGMDDRDGTKIFDNDICEAYCNIYTIAWDDGNARYEARQYGCTMDDLDMFFASSCKVIGNRFDNPELLERSFV